MKRHADPITIDHIIELRRKLAEAERQRDNALDFVWELRMDNLYLRAVLQNILTKEYAVDCKDIARAALKEDE